MPGFDGTGPLGLGPMTGGARGYCVVPLNPYSSRVWFAGIPWYLGGQYRGWFGHGRGGGRGWRHWYYATGLPGWARAQYGFPPMAVRAYYSPFGYYY